MKKSTKRVVQKDILGSSFTNSWKLMWENKSLFLPDIFSMIITWFFVVMFLVINGMSNLLKIVVMNQENSSQFIADNFKNIFTSESAGKLLLSGLVLFLVIVFVNVMFSCIKYLIMKQITNEKTVSFKEAKKSWKEYFWGFIGLNVLSALIILGVALTGVLIYVILNALVPKAWAVLSAILAVVFILVLMFAIAYFILGLLYAKVIYFMENTKAIEAINKSFKFFKENTKNVILTVLIITGISIGFGIFTNILTYFQTSTGIALWLSYIFAALSVLVGIVQTVWTSLFLFLSWKK